MSEHHVINPFIYELASLGRNSPGYLISGNSRVEIRASLLAALKDMKEKSEYVKSIGEKNVE